MKSLQHHSRRDSQRGCVEIETNCRAVALQSLQRLRGGSATVFLYLLFCRLLRLPLQRCRVRQLVFVAFCIVNIKIYFFPSLVMHILIRQVVMISASQAAGACNSDRGRPGVRSVNDINARQCQTLLSMRSTSSLLFFLQFDSRKF